MRTIRRQAVELNPGKQRVIETIMRAYAAEKQQWLQVFSRKDNRMHILKHRTVRDRAMANGYTCRHGLQARMWKLALIDAAETWDKYWKALFAELRTQVNRRNDFDESMRHYAFWLMSGYNQFFQCMDGNAPNARFAMDSALRRKVASFIRRKVARLKGKAPVVASACSFKLDADCYSAFAHNGRQYLSIMTLQKGNRLRIPLLGHTAITGTIKIVSGRTGIEAHLSSEVTARICEGPDEAVDFGYTEAMTDTAGLAYGDDLGRLITTASDVRNEQGKKRNKLRALAERYAKSSSAEKRRKASRIRTFNLGRIKWDVREYKSRAAIECEINRGLNRLISTRRPETLITEDLSHAFTFDKPKHWNRRLSAWTRGILADRVQFKALAEGFCHEQVNPAYSSQTCPGCGYVDAKNRSFDRFRCLQCGHEDHADRVAALNLKNRHGDREISRYTPYRHVKTILHERFLRRLEAEGKLLVPEATVPGRTSDTGLVVPLQSARRKSQQGGHAMPDHLPVTRRANQNKAC